MKFISEEIIDKVAEEIGQTEESFQAAMIDLKNDQPVITAFIFSEDFDLLTQDEKEYFLFLSIVIFKSIKMTHPELPQISEETLGEAQEKNWTLLSEVKTKKFRDRVGIFFENYDQEDLLAFVEDSLTEEEEDLITKVGREPMFIALKSLIDVLSLA